MHDLPGYTTCGHSTLDLGTGYQCIATPGCKRDFEGLCTRGLIANQVSIRVDNSSRSYNSSEPVGDLCQQ